MSRSLLGGMRPGGESSRGVAAAAAAQRRVYCCCSAASAFGTCALACSSPGTNKHTGLQIQAHRATWCPRRNKLTVSRSEAK